MIWPFFYKGAYRRRGPVTMSAISAVDIWRVSPCSPGHLYRYSGRGA
ncbi:hypothetical protein DQ99_003542 [Salmonella enterica subsp. houtenae serovar 40:z4,z24:-]|uniref:Uncharacterized protein n=1 Tax=Salmonella enterica subsp. VII serovar 40:z4,z24:[z39] TaxID=1967625 RepID=A0A731XW31_SALEE|nr:hypothetical protein [Salmonella enterica]EDS6439088.1 hypothetical protein [Salmonella enterica subsp. VII str. CFSAN000550]EDT6886618.1 hypothetical protein [Salmonella enterica subsp. enterica]EDU6342694.1 hypothetical protein [Salmonella enterica subsp. houtenae serovar 40:z4,z24:-]EDU7899089.1 hypothetical protein [Salmonella enterica subsp. houtenae]HAE4734521.1 hypothetical protein [Salmonella enterica subsp. VII serovar 40:z4,z24:[z39]]